MPLLQTANPAPFFWVEKTGIGCYTVFNSQETGERPVRERRREVQCTKPVLRKANLVISCGLQLEKYCL